MQWTLSSTPDSYAARLLKKHQMISGDPIQSPKMFSREFLCFTNLRVHHMQRSRNGVAWAKSLMSGDLNPPALDFSQIQMILAWRESQALEIAHLNSNSQLFVGAWIQLFFWPQAALICFDHFIYFFSEVWPTRLIAFLPYLKKCPWVMYVPHVVPHGALLHNISGKSYKRSSTWV